MDVEITPEPTEAERQAILVALSHEESEEPPARSRWPRRELDEENDS